MALFPSVSFYVFNTEMTTQIVMLELKKGSCAHSY